MEINFETLKGKTLKNIQINGNKDCITFETEDNIKFIMYHEQECCEGVCIEDINGDLFNLIGSPITLAEKVTSRGNTDDYDSYTWTFYKIATISEFVTIRWYGVSNGNYSEEVSFKTID